MHQHNGPFTAVAELLCDPSEASVFEHGWQSWSPTGIHPARATSPRAVEPHAQIRNYRPSRPGPSTGCQGEGLLAVQPRPDGPVSIFALPDPHGPVPSVRTRVAADRIVILADGPVVRTIDDGPGGIAGALDRYGAAVATRMGLPTPEPAALPTVWCSWYCHWDQVGERDIGRALHDLDAAELPIDVVQVDDGYQAEIGDWLAPSSRFAAIPQIAARIRDHGRRAGIWTAPFLAGEHSRIVAERPELFCRDLDAGEHWGQRLHALDVTHPAAAEHLTEVFTTLAAWGFDYFKIDFVYAGALATHRHADITPEEAYRLGLTLIRKAIGPTATLVGCGAPIFPSIGLVDAMRTSPDVAPHWQPTTGDFSAPSMRNALHTGAARRFTRHWWVTDPDCVLARPEVAQRDMWAAHVQDTQGLLSFSDRLTDLDPAGLEIYRVLLNGR